RSVMVRLSLTVSLPRVPHLGTRFNHRPRNGSSPPDLSWGGGEKMNHPKHMSAAFIDALGGPRNIRIGDLPVPEPGATDVLVRMEASEVNHVDLFVRSGAFPTPLPFPFVIGRDLVGTV